MPVESSQLRGAPAPLPSMRVWIGYGSPGRSNQSGSAVIAGNATTYCQTRSGGAFTTILVVTAYTGGFAVTSKNRLTGKSSAMPAGLLPCVETPPQYATMLPRIERG